MRIFLITLLLGISVLTMAKDIILPVFSMSEYDLKNGIIDVFIQEQKDGSKLSVTVVFKDEDHPCFLLDPLYDIYRFFRYGRVADIETFFFHLNPDGSIKALEFPGVFAGDHSFRDTKDLHGTAILMAEELIFIDGRPLIYVNTWNHMFGVRPSFDSKDEKLIFDYNLSQGGRQDSEKKYSWH